MKRWIGALGLSGIGFYIARIILLSILGGRWLDSKQNSEPLWLIIGVILGFTGAFLGVYNMIRPFISNKQNGEDS